MSEMKVRKPTLHDAPGIQALLQSYADRQLLLPLNLSQVCERLRDFHIADLDGKVVGCGALRLWGGDLAEVRSVAVAESQWRKGVGRAVLDACIAEGRNIGVKTVFVLTYQPEFFEKLGFKRVTKEMFPQKIWADCANCPQFPNCNEVALALKLD